MRLSKKQIKVLPPTVIPADNYNVVNMYFVGTPPAEESKTWQNLITGGVSGEIAKQAWHGYQVSNTWSHNDVVEIAITNGISPNHASTVADNILAVIRAEPTKTFLVAVAVTGSAYAILDGISAISNSSISKWSQKKKFALSLLCAAVTVIIYVVLRSKGIFA